MVTCKVDAVPKMNRPRKSNSSLSSGFRLLDGDQLDAVSSISRNSIYKIKIDAMFDDSRSVTSQRLDDRRGSQRTRSIIMYGKEELAAAARKPTEKGTTHPVQQDVNKISNSVQAQIERMFTDVAKDATSCSFSVRCLGSLPLKDKVTSLQGLQDPLRQLYLTGAGQSNQKSGNLDICTNGLRVQTSADRDPQITSFHNIAVWSAVKFVLSPSEGGAAFLPLITDPENIDKSTLFRPLTAADQRRLSSGLHAPIFAVVMRSAGVPKILECHGFVCQTPEDAIVIAATLYQSLMAHVSTNPNNSARRRTPRNQNGVSCISIASSSALTNSNYMGRSSSVMQPGRKSSFRNAGKNPAAPVRPTRKKRIATSSLSGESDTVREVAETTTEERKKKSHKTKKAPPIPTEKASNRSNSAGEHFSTSMSFLEKQSRADSANRPAESIYHANEGATGDILTKVAIPRSGSFLNTGGLSRYKSRATRRNSGKNGGGGGSPLGFSELFNEFRLNENLHSLDDILNAIINADGMSFNDLKPIYKEFLLKLAVTLTKDELYQRSKNIMRRQKKRKMKKRHSTAQKKHRSLILGAKGLKKVFWFGHFRSCTSPPSKATKTMKSKHIINQTQYTNTGKTTTTKTSHRTRTGTSGSDVSENRNENTLNGLNRNSSSGYVSCSECSYDSDACTCASADRCYCSLGADHDRVREKLSRNRGARDSLLSCKTEDKCYCSMKETNGENSETTWCDSDSCFSSSKCYCKRNGGTTLKKGTRSNSNNLAVDYELFTIGGDGRSVKPHEALSVKKSVEVAAVFADVKLSQTTDVSSLKAGVNYIRKTSRQSRESVSSSNRRRKPQKSSSANDIFSKLEVVEKANYRKNSVKDEGYYQSVRAISASLEDSLGYLP